MQWRQSTVCRHYGIDQEIIRKALKTIRVPGRVEVIDNDRGYLLLIDYAHNAMSLKNILETMRRYHPRQLWVFSDAAEADQQQVAERWAVWQGNMQTLQ